MILFKNLFVTLSTTGEAESNMPSLRRAVTSTEIISSTTITRGCYPKILRGDPLVRETCTLRFRNGSLFFDFEIGIDLRPGFWRVRLGSLFPITDTGALVSTQEWWTCICFLTSFELRRYYSFLLRKRLCPLVILLTRIRTNLFLSAKLVSWYSLWYNKNPSNPLDSYQSERGSRCIGARIYLRIMTRSDHQFPKNLTWFFCPFSTDVDPMFSRKLLLSVVQFCWISSPYMRRTKFVRV